MLARSMIAIGLGTVAVAALAQTAGAPIERKSGNTVQAADEAVPANRAAVTNTADRTAPNDEATTAPANGTAPIEPKH